MDGSFANQVLAQIHLFGKKFADNSKEFKDSNIEVEVLPKHLDEQVAALMVEGFGGVMTKLTPIQADYINVSTEGRLSQTHININKRVELKLMQEKSETNSA